MTRIEDDIAAIRNAASRDEASTLRNRIANDGAKGLRTREEWQAACDAFNDRWGVDAVGGYPGKTAGDRYLGD